MTVRYLCVGGYHAGSYLTATEDEYHLQLMHPVGLKSPVLDLNKVETVIETYKRQEWSTPQGKVYFWVPVDQTPMETLKLLIEEYMK